MKAGRVIIISVVIIVIVIIGAVYFVLTNLDAIVEAAIEKYGSQVTQTGVRVSSVKIKLTEGSGGINGVTVGNPKGFSSPYAFSLGTISTKIDTGSLTKELIIIDEILISAPQVIYEINASGASNINVLKKNIQQSIKGPSEKEPSPEKGEGKEVKLLIRKLVFEKGQIDVRIAALEEARSVKLPSIHLTNIGKGAGATPKEIAEQALNAIIRQVGPAVAQVGVEKYLGKSIEEAKQQVEGEVTKKLGEEMGESVSKEADDTVKKLFGK